MTRSTKSHRNGMNLQDKQKKFLGQLNERRKILYKMAFVYCRRSEDRKDLIQEMPIQLWRSYEKFDVPTLTIYLQLHFIIELAVLSKN